MPVTIRIDARETLRKLTKEFLVMPDRFEIAVDRAINRTLITVRKEGNKLATQRYTAVREKPRDTARLFKSFKGMMTGEIEFTGRRGSSLRNFRPSPQQQKNKRPKQGISSLVIKGGARKVYTDEAGNKPFWMPMKQGGFGLFYNRRLKNKHKKWQGITLAYGPSGIQAIMRKEAREKLRSLAETTLSKNMVSQLVTVINGYDSKNVNALKARGYA